MKRLFGGLQAFFQQKNSSSLDPNLRELASFLAEKMDLEQVIEIDYSRWNQHASILDPALLRRAGLVCHGSLDLLPRSDKFFAALGRWLDHAGFVILSTPRTASWNEQRLGMMLRSRRLPVELTGYAGLGGKDTVAAVLRRRRTETAARPLRVLAILALYDEADIIIPIVKNYTAQGIYVYLIDCWSDDETYALAHALRNEDEFVVGLERFPEKRPKTYQWKNVLKRKEEIAQTLPFDWYIHSDPDEIRCSPWEDISLLGGIQIADQEGYNALDFTVLNFSPVNELEYPPHTDPSRYFEYFDFGHRPGHFRQVKVWKNTNQPVCLAAQGGHMAEFEGRRVYPYKFILKHYPFRSQRHGQIKISESVRRTEKEHREHGWHNHYRLYGENHRFYRKPEELIKFDDSFYGNFLVERISGIGIPRKRDDV